MGKIRLIRILTSAGLTLLIIFLVDGYFHKYSGSVQLKEHFRGLSYAADLDGDGNTEFVSRSNINKEKIIYREYWQNNTLLRVERLPTQFIKHPTLVGDCNNDGQIDEVFLSKNKDSCFLNRFSFAKDTNRLEHQYEKFFLFEFKDSSERLYCNYVKFHDLNQDGTDEVVFQIYKGLAHRQLCVFDFKTESLKRSKTQFMLVYDIEVGQYDKDENLDIIVSTYANGNLPGEYLDLAAKKIEVDQDELFSDMSAVLAKLDDNLKPEILVKKEGFTSMIRHKVFKLDGKTYCAAIESNLMDSLDQPKLKTYDLKGNQLASYVFDFQIPANKLGKFAPNHLAVIERENDVSIFVQGICDSILEFDKNLKLKKTHHYQGFTGNTLLALHDLDDDGHDEIICNAQGGYWVFQDHFEDELFLPCKNSKKLNQGFHEFYQNGKYVDDIAHGGDAFFHFNYSFNPYYYWKYGLYVFIFIGFYLLIYMLQKLQMIQLENENKKLEGLVNERTKELELKNTELSETLSIIDEKNREILDSISYAKRIQSAILPPMKFIKEHLADAFVLYKPKDVVAGDFYWLEEVGDQTLFAAADCTGHGVPGAMVSVVCNSGLNRSVREFGLKDPGEILDKARQLVIKEFEKSEEEVKDGMDIALCRLDGKKLYYAGAHNPLWIIRKGNDEMKSASSALKLSVEEDGYRLYEIKGDKQPIGKYAIQDPFTTHSIELKEGDTIYLSSDGYADQFGGEKGKKFKGRNFKKLLISIQDLDMEEQKSRIDQVFEAWRGNLEQVDDVCVIGVRI